MSNKNAVGLESSHNDLEAQSTEETITALVEIIEDQQETIDDLQERLSDLEDEQDDERDTRAREDAQLRQRITDVEDRLDDVEDSGFDGTNPTPDTEESPSTKPVTALEDLTTLPERVLDGESANTQRAVFVARDVTDYAQSVPAGYSITSSDLRKVLKAGTDCHGHTQTVSRVMDLLEDLGGDGVKLIDRRGTKRVVFEEDLVERLKRLTAERKEPHGCDRGSV
jgi:DNA gyrase/topoisomerase IV subunit A